MTHPGPELLLSLLQLKANREMQNITSGGEKENPKGNYAEGNPKLIKKNPKIVALVGCSTLVALPIVLPVALFPSAFPYLTIPLHHICPPPKKVPSPGTTSCVVHRSNYSVQVWNPNCQQLVLSLFCSNCCTVP